jgi:hypothetical protein
VFEGARSTLPISSSQNVTFQLRHQAISTLRSLILTPQPHLAYQNLFDHPFKGILAAGLLVASASANLGLLHDEPHHTHKVLENIHIVPHCTYSCIFHDTYPGKFAPDCVGLKGIEYGACLCKSNAYQYIFDQCVAIKCGKDDAARKAV